MGIPSPIYGRGTVSGWLSALPGTTEMLTVSAAGIVASQTIPSGGVTAHSGLTGLTSGDDHTQYALLAGRSGGQTLKGAPNASGTNTAGGNQVIAPGASTGNATPSKVCLQSSVAGASGTTVQTLYDTLVVTAGQARLYDSGGTKYSYLGSDGTYGIVGASVNVMSFVSAAGDFFFGTSAGGFTSAALQASSARLLLGSSITQIAMGGTAIYYSSNTSSGTFQTFIHGNTQNSTFRNFAAYGISGLNGQFGGTNSAGSDLVIEGGRATGSAAGGKVTIQTCPAGSSGTTLQTPATAMQVDSNTTAGETRLLLLDITAGTVKRVSIGASDSGGSGYKVLRVPN